MISIIHPTRGRKQMAFDTAAKWFDRADGSFEYILSVDTSENENYDAFYTMGDRDTWVCENDNKTAIEAINNAAKKCKGDLIIVVSDDFDCPEHWDTLLLKALTGKEDFIVKTRDGLQDWIITLPILDKFYYNRFGYVYPPHIRHMFADTWMTHVADLTDRKIIVDILFEHLHYSARKGDKDKINIRNEGTWADGEAKYLEGVRNNFGLSNAEIKGTLKADFKLIQWLKERNVYVI